MEANIMNKDIQNALIDAGIDVVAKILKKILK